MNYDSPDTTGSHTVDRPLQAAPEGSSARSAFASVAELAVRLLDCGIAVVSVGLKSIDGIVQAPDESALVIHGDDWSKAVLSAEPRSFADPVLADEMGLRFFIGVPLRTADGSHHGTLAVLDRKQREVTPEQIDSLKRLASLVVEMVEHRIGSSQLPR